MKKTIILLIVMINCNYLIGQQLAQFSLRTYDLMNFNPAVAGSSLNQEIRLHHRSQWVGFENAPTSDLLSYSTSINKVGLGITLFYDSEVTIKNIGAKVDYAYHIFCNKFNISLGASAGIQQNQLNTSLLNPFEKDDPLIIPGAKQTKLIPTVGGGFFMYNWNYYFGSSFTYYLPYQMASGDYYETNSSILYYAMGGYKFHLSDNFNLLTQAFMSGQGNSNYQLEFGVRAQFMEALSLGVAYRPDDAIVLSTGIKLFKSILIAYSYDVIISKLRNYNSGSHEIVISYELSNKKFSNSKYKKRSKRINTDIVF